MDFRTILRRTFRKNVCRTQEKYVGVTYSFQYPVAMRFNELMTGARQDVVCKIFGENMDTKNLC
jgi:Cu/Ag efflux pump CusA